MVNKEELTKIEESIYEDNRGNYYKEKQPNTPLKRPFVGFFIFITMINTLFMLLFLSTLSDINSGIYVLGIFTAFATIVICALAAVLLEKHFTKNTTYEKINYKSKQKTKK